MLSRRIGGRGLLRCGRDVGAAVALPAVFGLIGADRAFLAVANQAQLSRRDAHRHKELLRGARAAVAERQIVLLGTALIRVAFDQQFLVGIIGQDVPDHGDISLQNGGCIVADGRLIVIEQGVVQMSEFLVERGAFLRSHRLPALL